MNLTDLQKQTCKGIVEIFETGKLNQNGYGAVANSETDTGGLSYGRHQASLNSGNLFLLIDLYCAAPGAIQADKLRGFLPELRAKSIHNAAALIPILKQAGTDPVMKKVQEDFFDVHFWEPAMKRATGLGFVEPLSAAVVYDSFIQSGQLRPFPIGVDKSNERNWIEQYCHKREPWLASLKSDARKSTYRPQTFLKLIEQNKWSLPLPLTVRGVVIMEANL